jgi:hypothetical protein
MAHESFGRALPLTYTDLYGAVAIARGFFLLHDTTWFDFDRRHRYGRASLIEDGRHPDLLADYANHSNLP